MHSQFLIKHSAYALQNQIPDIQIRVLLPGCQVEEETMYGILSTKIHHTFLSRPADASELTLICSKTFNSSEDQEPSVRCLYLYQLYLASHAAKVPLAERGKDTSPDKDWLAPPSKDADNPGLHGGSTAGNLQEPRGSPMRLSSGPQAGEEQDSAAVEGSCRLAAHQDSVAAHSCRAAAANNQFSSHQFGQHQLLRSLEPVPRCTLDIRREVLSRDAVHVVSLVWPCNPFSQLLWLLVQSWIVFGKVHRCGLTA